MNRINTEKKIRVAGILAALVLTGSIGYARLNCASPIHKGAGAAFSVASGAQLSAHDVGIYGINPWRNGLDDPKDPSFFNRVAQATFCLKRVRINSTTDPKITTQMVDSVNADLRAAEKLSPIGKEILMLDFWDNGEHYRVTPGLQDYSVYHDRVMSVLGRLNLSSPALIGVSLSEENVVNPSNGRDQILSQLYSDVKAQYPSLSVYQWYMGQISSGIFVPGHVPPDQGPAASIPADGYVIDPYELHPGLYPDTKFHLGGDPYDTLVRKYLATGKPLISLVWGSSEFPGNRTPGIFEPDTPGNMFNIMDHQVTVNIKYGVPTMFYWIEFAPNLKSKVSYFGDEGKYPFSQDTDPVMPQINAFVKKEMARIKGG